MDFIITVLRTHLELPLSLFAVSGWLRSGTVRIIYKRTDSRAMRRRVLLEGILEDPDKDRKQELLDWISAVLGDPSVAKEPFNQVLKNGVVICQLMNKLSPGSVKRIQKKGTKFTFMENIEAFQKASQAYGLPEEEKFMPTDLIEARNIKAVLNSLFALARIAQDKGFDGPTMGPKMAHPGEKTDWHAKEQEKFAAMRAANGE